MTKRRIGELSELVKNNLMPAVIHIPHASLLIPKRYRDQFVLSDIALQREALASADLYTDILAKAAWPRARHLVAHFSRLLVDVERYPHDKKEKMAQQGRGMLYQKTHQLKALRRPLTATERQHLKQKYYNPHWAKIRRLSRGKILIDLHSYPAKRTPIESSPKARRPHIDLGTAKGFTKPSWVLRLKKHFRQCGYSVGINTPYKGVITPKGVRQAIMIEIRRDILGQPGQPRWNKLVHTLRTLPLID
jgi:N-formylglutamate amidohydrolase